MLVCLEFHENDKAISTEDKEMSSEQIIALLNSKAIQWPLDKKGQVRG